jgi:hypothetical protein
VLCNHLGGLEAINIEEVLARGIKSCREASQLVSMSRDIEHDRSCLSWLLMLLDVLSIDLEGNLFNKVREAQAGSEITASLVSKLFEGPGPKKALLLVRTMHSLKGFRPALIWCVGEAVAKPAVSWADARHEECESLIDTVGPPLMLEAEELMSKANEAFAFNPDDVQSDELLIDTEEFLEQYTVQVAKDMKQLCKDLGEIDNHLKIFFTSPPEDSSDSSLLARVGITMRTLECHAIKFALVRIVARENFYSAQGGDLRKFVKEVYEEGFNTKGYNGAVKKFGAFQDLVCYLWFAFRLSHDILKVT